MNENIFVMKMENISPDWLGISAISKTIKNTSLTRFIE